MWYTDRGADQDRALAVCRGCPVRIDCLGFALLNPEFGNHGIWGGYSERKLRNIKREWRRGDRAKVRGISPWAVGALDELASRGIGWGP